MMYPMSWMILGCTEPADTGSDTDTAEAQDTDTDDPETDTGDTAALPCPFEGAWDLVEISTGGDPTFEDGSAANMAGTAEVCEWDLLIVRPDCRQHEIAVWEAEPFGAWTAWSDGAPDMVPESCGFGGDDPFESRVYPELSDDGQTLTVVHNSAIFAHQPVTFTFSRLN